MNKDLIEYRLKAGKEKLESADILLKNGMYKDPVSRSYYAMFSAARALLATKGLDSSKHSGIIPLFNQYFVKSHVAGKTMGKLLAEAREARETGDYHDFVTISKEEAQEQLETAKVFIQEIEHILKKILEEADEK